MKIIIQISVIILAIGVGSIWEAFRPEIHNFLRLAEPVAANDIPQKTNLAAKKPAEKLGAAGADPMQNKSSSSEKTELPDTSPEPTKVVIAPAAPVKPVVPVLSSEEVLKAQKEQIEGIVMERYPDLPKIPFSEKYSDLSKLPRGTYPERIQIGQALNFKLTQDEKLVGISVVKAEGFVRPRRIDGDQIEVSSLTHDDMMETLPLSETNFTAVIQADYDAGLERAIARVEKMREADKLEISKNPGLYKKIITEDKVWHDSDATQFDEIKTSIKQILAGRPFKPVAFYGNGLVQVEDGANSGVYYAVIVLLEGADTGFGPYHWRVKCLLREGQIVRWEGIPEKSSAAKF